MNKSAISITSKTALYDDGLKRRLMDKIHQLGDFNFSDDAWYCKSKHKDSRDRSQYTIRFHKINKPYKNLLKYYALTKNHSIFLIQQKVYKISVFLNFLDENYPEVTIKNINRNIINAYEYSISIDDTYKQNTKSSLYSSISDFFKSLKGFPELPINVPTKTINPFKQVRNAKDRSIPPFVIQKMDRIMKNMKMNIPLEFRTYYWLIRSFPNRGTEILSMKRGCLKSFYSEYTISVPTFKQNGGYDEPETKVIPVIYSGHGKFVVELIRNLQEQTEDLLTKFSLREGDKENYLFIGKYFTFCNGIDGNIEVRYDKRYEFIRNLSITVMNRYLKNFAKVIGVVDENGDSYNVTSHQFRHNAVTDRMYQVGYTMEQIIKLTGHKNINMPSHYLHQLKERQKEVHLNIGKLKGIENNAVSFKGRIMNLDTQTINFLLKDLNKYLTWEANGKKGVGICGDISGCNPKGTSILFECYACEWFIPRADYYDDYKKEYEYWQAVIERIGTDSRRASQLENAIRNVSYLERIIKICEKGIEQYQTDIVDK
ncbi:Site-specific recombinase XerD [Bacillus toyonensis]|uniref:tyrosine-type recombinase/integrase n=1 Tax=Bacillus toyonensis TaxID=155322 RepID=UPI000882CB28|nr:tyrosine-type recombinase/integrase [Bacillus toyonensis]SDK32222.1 Site-specific recombinase XerD [Bacillus toyonensis]